MTTDIIMKEGNAVTVVASRIVEPGNELRHDRWARRMMSAATKAPGNTGVTMLVPEPGKPGLYHIVFHFADQKSVDAWEVSEERRKLTEEADVFSKSFRQASTGLETWFEVPDCPHLAAPPHWKMFLITALAVFVVSCAYIPLLRWLFNDFTLVIPNVTIFIVENLIASMMIVGSLTWIIMPFLSQKVLNNWLYK